MTQIAINDPLIEVIKALLHHLLSRTFPLRVYSVMTPGVERAAGLHAYTTLVARVIKDICVALSTMNGAHHQAGGFVT